MNANNTNMQPEVINPVGLIGAVKCGGAILSVYKTEKSNVQLFKLDGDIHLEYFQEMLLDLVQSWKYPIGRALFKDSLPEETNPNEKIWGETNVALFNRYNDSKELVKMTTGFQDGNLRIQVDGYFSVKTLKQMIRKAKAEIDFHKMFPRGIKFVKIT